MGARLVMVFPAPIGINERAFQLAGVENRLGFARLAIQRLYPIVPFASVGAEHGIDIVLDNESPLLAPVRFLARSCSAPKDGPGAGPWCRTDF